MQSELEKTADELLKQTSHAEALQAELTAQQSEHEKAVGENKLLQEAAQEVESLRVYFFVFVFCCVL